MVPLRLDMTARVRPAHLHVRVSNDDDEDDERLSFHVYASELLRGGVGAGGGESAASGRRRCGLTLSNHLESVLSFQLSLADPFLISAFDPKAPPPPSTTKATASTKAVAASRRTGLSGGKSASTKKSTKSTKGLVGGVTPAPSAAAADISGGAASVLRGDAYSAARMNDNDRISSNNNINSRVGNNINSRVGNNSNNIDSRVGDNNVNSRVGANDDDDYENGEIRQRHRFPSSAVTASEAAPAPLSVVAKEYYALRPLENVHASIGFQLTAELLSEVQMIRREQDQLQQQQLPQQQQQQQQQHLQIQQPQHQPQLQPQRRRGFELVSDSVYEEKLVIDKTLDVVFNNGDVQRLPVRAVVQLPVLGLNVGRIDFGESFIGQVCEAEIVLFNRSHCDSRWTVERVVTTTMIEGGGGGGATAATAERCSKKDEAEENIFSIFPTSGFLTAFGGGVGGSSKSSFETHLRVEFCASAVRDYEAVFEIGGQLGERPRRLTLKGRGSGDEATVALYR